jgi:transposase
MATLFGMFPFLKTLFADSGYQGSKFAKALAKVLPHLDIEIVKRSDQVSGFVVLPKRWIVERTIAWLNRCRRLAKDWENLNRKALAFLRLASIRLMLSVCPGTSCSSESFVIQGWRSDLKGRPCGRRRTAVVTTEAGYAIPAI